ncbi:MAG TPA: Maf family nucleotide pyrophosphatase [Rhizomicrobium sp.]|nr:Maf family nucleotide pyrophosphatase [Rhizomicrobium sp.]
MASGSETRAKLLRSAGLTFDIIPPHVDELTVKEALVAEGVRPRDLADALAELKAAKVSMSHPGALVIGSDQILVFEGKIISKSSDIAEAKALLQRLSGHRHQLLTAVVLARSGAIVWRHVASAELVVRSLSDDFIDRYLASQGEAVLSSVGCYQLEGEGIQLFSQIDGDYFGILGLPLLPLLNALRDMGALPA